MREMPYGQWVAFDGYDSVHKCGQMSEYEATPSASSRGHGSRGHSTQAPPASQQSVSQSASDPKGGQQSWSPQKKEKGWPLGLVADCDCCALLCAQKVKILILRSKLDRIAAATLPSTFWTIGRLVLRPTFFRTDCVSPSIR
jgi:hypothetical protein